MTILVQISDLHIREHGKIAYGVLDTATYLDQTVKTLLRLPQAPDAVIVTGDLADSGSLDDYARVQHLLSRLNAPLYLMPGNHDDRANLRTAFPAHTYLGNSGFIQYTARVGELHVVALDTTEPGQEAGALCTERLDWLNSTLNALSGQPVIVAMHHPPFNTLIGHMDAIGLRAGTNELETLIARHPNVQRIICGHLHRAIETCFGGTLASICPAPAHQITFDLHPQAPATWILEPPAFRVHVWDAQSKRLISHLVPVGQFDGPHPFD